MTIPAILALNAAVIAALMASVWLLSVAVRDASIVDIAWGPGFALVALSTLIAADDPSARAILLAALTAVWGLRLGLHIGSRNVGKGEDFRYQAMRRRRGPGFWWISAFTVFATQGALIWVVSLPVQVGQAQGSIGALEIAGACVWAIGFAFESIGDLQLRRFKADPATRGTVMDRGLWRYTRHPNYFGDFAVWWGLYLIALGIPGRAWWTIVGPLVMSTLLMRVSGVAMLERSMSKRPGYAEYAARTSAFFPRPPRSA